MQRITVIYKLKEFLLTKKLQKHKINDSKAINEKEAVIFIYINKYKAYDGCTQYTLNMTGRALFIINQLFVRILSSINSK
jgi:hypothetical protein